MLDLSAASNLQVAAVRRMTSDPQLAAHCDEWLRGRGVRGPRHFLTLWFSSLAAGGLLFVWMDFDEMVDAELPSKRLLISMGATVLVLFSTAIGFILFLLAQMHSWPWRIGMAIFLTLVGAVEWWRAGRQLRR